MSVSESVSHPITVLKKMREKKKGFVPRLQKYHISSKIFDILAFSLNNCKLDCNKAYKPMDITLNEVTGLE